jgi:hypothetical protein
MKSPAIFPCAKGFNCVLSRSYFLEGGGDNLIELDTYPRDVFSAQAVAAVNAEWRDGGLNPQEALDWRRTG